MTPLALSPNDTDCPIAMDQLGTLIRASAAELDRQADSLPEGRRAELALFCAGRSHLRPIGLRIASRCDERSLERLAGVAGSVLFAQSRAGAPAAETRSRGGVTLARRSR